MQFTVLCNSYPIPEGLAVRVSRVSADLARGTGEGMPTEEQVTVADAGEHIGIVTDRIGTPRPSFAGITGSLLSATRTP
jgi:hypothetical protein